MSARRPARVLQVVHRYVPEMGGTETHVAEVSRRIAQHDDLDLTILTTDRTGQLPKTAEVGGVPVVRRRSWPRPPADLYLSPAMAAAVAGGGWDLVHFQGVHTLVPPLGMAAAAASRTPYVLTFHSGGHSSPARRGVRGAQWKALAPLLRRADRLIAVSRFERGAFAAATGTPLSRFAVIPNGGALPEAPDDVVPVGGRILSVGRLERYKGHHRVIEALPLVQREVPDAHLVVLGAGPYRDELLSLAARNGVSRSTEVRALPPSDRAGMVREQASASVLAAMSEYEAHPVAVMEAVTLGLPVLGADVAGTADMVEDGHVTGIRPDASAEELAAALVAQLRATAARGPRPHAAPAVTLPTWDDSAAMLADVYRQVLRARGADLSL